MYALVVSENGGEWPILPANGEKFTLEELQMIVGGYIEIVHLTDKTLMVLDEEGKLKGKKMNLYATGLFRRLKQVQDYIVGDVMIVPSKMID